MVQERYVKVSAPFETALTREIEKLQEQLNFKKRALATKQANCKHQWTKPVNDDEQYKEAVYSHLEPHGSDPEAIYTYHDAWKKRWRRDCPLCEKVEYTYETAPVKYAPKFRT